MFPFVILLLTIFTTACDVKEGSAAEKSNHFPAIRKRVTPSLEAELGKMNLKVGAPVFIRAFKETKKLELWIESKRGGAFELFRTYDICAASGDLGPKQKEGDRQVPEGFYATNLGLLNPASKYHLSFNIGYPNAFDRHHKRTGSLIMIHGNCVSLGCLAMTDEKIEEIYTLIHAALSKGRTNVPVHIFPFRLTEENLAKIDEEEVWLPFWKNLKEGYDLFETNKRPPSASVDKKSGRYVLKKG